ncbi:HNH endonuclease [Thalassospira xiamenensis]|uniref:HNH endonuclease n=1 Tax=Thalassospira xiamenensis TaxID=220697 RepID=UPI000DEDAA8C|nr:HNH endonuclease signature motif containing protein [Thalassospira xiamenensis]
MPALPTKPCALARCGRLAQPGERYCTAHKQEHRKRDDQRRGSSNDRGYTSKWRKAREAFLKEHPLCCRCEAGGMVTAATVVDHIVPHKGDQKLFWRRSNWQPLCKHHHDVKTATEDGAFGRGVAQGGGGSNPYPPTTHDRLGGHVFMRGKLKRKNPSGKALGH